MATDVTHSVNDDVAEAISLGNQAFFDGDLELALMRYREAAEALTPADDEVATAVYENIGLAACNLGLWREATRSFLRALDGGMASRQQSSRLIVTCFHQLGEYGNASRYLAAYEAAFGSHPINQPAAHAGLVVATPPESSPDAED